MAADRMVAQHAFFACCFYSKPPGAGWPFQVFGKSKSSVLSLLDLVFCSLTPLEFPHSALERGRTFRRVRLGSLVLKIMLSVIDIRPAWFHIVISRETLFHYYIWGFLKFVRL